MYKLWKAKRDMFKIRDAMYGIDIANLQTVKTGKIPKLKIISKML